MAIIRDKAVNNVNANRAKRRSFLLLFLSLFVFPGLAFANQCLQLYSGVALARPAVSQAVKREATEPETVKFIGNDGEVVTLERVGSDWFSRYEHIPGTKTVQGDPRFPMAVFGSFLAEKMGFAIYKGSDGKLYMQAPSAKKMQKLIAHMNQKLIAQEKEPISYEPIPANFITAEEGLRLATQTDGAILMKFPYSDNDPRLTVHEISYHLGAILFPRSFFEKSLQINQLTVQLIERIRQHPSLGSLSEKTIKQLIMERAFELDSGTGNLTATLGHFRLIGLHSYDDLTPDLLPQTEARTAIGRLLKPGYSPLQAVMMRFAIMHNIHPKLLGLEQTAVSFNHYSKEGDQLGQRIMITSAEKEVLLQIAKEFMTEHQELNQLTDQRDTTEILRDFLSNLDQRIRDLTQTLEEN